MMCEQSDKKNNKGNYMNIEIIKDNEINDFNCCQEEHILCRKCFKELKNSIKSKIDNGEIDKETENLSLDCKICNIKHLIKFPKKLKNLMKLEEKEKEEFEEDNKNIKHRKKKISK